jgi:hypothetical protein
MRPTSVEPVKVTLRMRGSAIITSSPAPGRTPAAPAACPAGPPASSHSSASRSAVNGVCSAGLTIIVQPAASAGAALRVIIAAGKFQGVTA